MDFPYKFAVSVGSDGIIRIKIMSSSLNRQPKRKN